MCLNSTFDVILHDFTTTQIILSEYTPMHVANPWHIIFIALLHDDDTVFPINGSYEFKHSYIWLTMPRCTCTHCSGTSTKVSVLCNAMSLVYRSSYGGVPLTCETMQQ